MTFRKETGFIGLLCWTALINAATPSYFYVADGAPISGVGTVYSIDLATNTATQTIANDLMPPFSQPIGVAISPDGNFAYAVDWNTNNILYIDTNISAVTEIVPTSGSFINVNGVAISSDSRFAYVTDYGNGFIYYVDVGTNIATATGGDFPFPQPSVPAISLDASFVYVTDLGGQVYRIDPVTNQLAATVTGPFGYPVGVAIAPNGRKAYVADSGSGPIPPSLWAIDTNTNVGTPILSDLFQQPRGVAVSPDGNTVYVADPTAAAVFRIDAETNEVTQLVAFDCAITAWAVNTLSISPDGKSLYVAGGNAGNIWHIDIGSATATQIVNNTLVDFQSPTSPSNMFPWIPTSTLTGNNLTFAEYLNNQAPYIITRTFVPLQGDSLNSALQSAAPTRNALLTFASQTTQIAMGRLLNNHLQQNRWQQGSNRNTPVAIPPSEESLSADAGDLFQSKQSCGGSIPKKEKFSAWVGAFGEYGRGKKQHQTPGFEIGSGGALAAWDYNGFSQRPLGVGIAYAHTHVHEQGGAGHANIDQGDLFFYGTFLASNWYFDTALWGGYYHAKNLRAIAYPGFEGKAALSTHGWQLSPHLEIGYDYQSNWFGIEPFTMCDWVNCWEHKARESGASLLNMQQQGRYCSLLRSETGLRFEEILTCDWGTVTFMEKASYAYQKTFHTGQIHAFLVGSPGLFTVETLIGAQNLGVGELEVLLTPKNTRYPYASLGYHLELGSRYQTHQGLFELGGKF